LLILATASPTPAGDSFCKDYKNFWHTHKQKQQQHQPEHIELLLLMSGTFQRDPKRCMQLQQLSQLAETTK
jgi:hypothetical protein